MPGTCEQFAQAVVTAGVLSAEAVQSFWASLPANARPATAHAFAAALIKAGRLTPHQAQHVLALLTGPAFGPAFSPSPPGAAPPPAILHSGPVAAIPVAVAAPPARENMTLKILGGMFATIVAPLLVAVVVNRLSSPPEAPQPPAPQALATAPAPAAMPIVASAPPVVREPERPAPLESPPVNVAPPRAMAKTEETKSSQSHAPAKPAKPKPLSYPMDGKKVEAGQNEWAKFLKVPETTKNSLGMKLVLIPPGAFSMGNTPKRAMKVARVLKQASELERIHDELPQHKVTFAKPRLLGLNEVTIGQFGRFVADAKYVTEAEQIAGASKSEGTKHGPTWQAPGYPVADDFPVTHVTWNDAVAFCNWLSTAEKLKPCYRTEKGIWTRQSAADGYRLPTEAEWEYACRAGTTTEFYFGDDPDRLDDHAWFSANSDQAAKAVGLKRPNAFGLRDVYGNAREWCEDWYAADYYRESSPLDPRGPSSGSQRVTRGGSWYSGAARARSGDRAGVAPTFHSNQNGFRVLRGL